jgi:hypothetical protein
MKKNIGRTEKIIRLVFAVIFISLFLTGITKGLLGVIALVLGIIGLLTSLTGFCPLYRFFRVRTNSGDHAKV